MGSIKKNYLYNSLYEVLIIIIPLITTPYLTRTLGASGMGAYSYRYSIARYFGMFVLLGLNKYGNRSVAQCRDDGLKLKKTFWSIYYFQIIIGIIITIVYGLYCSIIRDKLAMILGLYVASCIFDINWLFFGLECFKFTVIRNAIIKITSTILIFILVKYDSDVWIYCLILSVATALSQVVLWPKAIGIIHYYHPTLKEIIEHIRPNIVLFLPVIAVSLYKTMDKIMLGLLSNYAQVGFYEASERIVGVPIAFIESLGTVMLPRMSYLVAKNDNSENSIFYKSLVFSVFVSTSLGFGIMGLANDFVPWYYGSDYSECIYLFYILLPAGIFIGFANVIRTQFLIPHKRDSIFIKSTFLGAIINMAINCMLIPGQGAKGAAFGTLISEFTVCLYQTIKIKDNITILKYALKTTVIVFCGIIMFTVLMNFRIDGNIYFVLGIKIATGFLIFIITLTLFEFISITLKRKTIFGFVDLNNKKEDSVL